MKDNNKIYKKQQEQEIRNKKRYQKRRNYHESKGEKKLENDMKESDDEK